MNNPKFSILITTKNRLRDLKLTLQKINYLLQGDDIECIICDDGSTDGTYEFLQVQHPKIQLFKNKVSKGLIYSRNRLLENTQAKYAISLDDDAHFLTDNVLKNIEEVFKSNKKVGLLTFRVFWGIMSPQIIGVNQLPYAVNCFIGCGHVWRMDAWRTIPNYPEWFQFYGEEQFAAFQLFKSHWHMYYVPDVLVHHRVDMKARKNNKDYVLRQRRSLRSGWYLYFMCYPKRKMFKAFFSSLWSQIKRKTFKGNTQATLAIVLALKDLMLHFNYFFNNKYRLTITEYNNYLKLPHVDVYWLPKNEIK